MISSVLVVGDDEGRRREIQMHLEWRGLHSLMAAPDEALTLAKSRSHDLVLFECRKASARDLSVLRELHLQDPRPVLLLMPGEVDIPLVVEAMREGADSVLPRPYDVDLVLSQADKL